MGCICSKVSAVEDGRENFPNKFPSSAKGAPESSRENNDKALEKDYLDGNYSRVSLVDNKDHGSIKLYHDQIFSDKKKEESPEVTPLKLNHPSFGRVPKAAIGEQVAAGWPNWLSAVAGEAISGWLPRCANTFEKLDKIGQGTYSSVYRARDMTYQKVVALKKVRFDNVDPESVKFMAREILVLRRLQHPNVIKLEGLITSKMSRSLYLVFEYMEHDLTGLVSRPGIKFSEPQVKCYMKQLLSGLDYCHSHGVLHRDIKGSNILIDNTGVLKIADFGLASFFDPNQNGPLTNRVVTLWYRPPELLLGASHYGVAVDLWSAGCILGELYTGKPILPGKTEVEQLHKIFKLCGSPSEDYWGKLRLPNAALFKPAHSYRCCLADTFKQIPTAAVRLIETLLSLDPASRGTAATALKSEFFRTEPLACDPSSLPAYPPSKEIDAKMMDEVCRRQGVSGLRERKYGLGIQPDKEHPAIPAAKANAGQLPSMQCAQAHSSTKSRTQLINVCRNESLSGFLVGPHKQSVDAKEIKRYHQDYVYSKPSYSGPLVHGAGWAKAGKEVDALSMYHPNKAKLPNRSGFMASKTQWGEDKPEKLGTVHKEKTLPDGRCMGYDDGSQSRRRHDPRYQTQRFAEFHHNEDGGFNAKDSTRDMWGSKGNKIYVSGPLLVSSNNVDQMLKDHDRRIQEFSRRTRLDKTRGDRVYTHRM